MKHDLTWKPPSLLHSSHAVRRSNLYLLLGLKLSISGKDNPIRSKGRLDVNPVETEQKIVIALGAQPAH